MLIILAKHLNLSAIGPHDQDWEYVVSDSSKIEEFVAYYENKTSIKWEKQILMAIIISSFDDSICVNSFNKELSLKLTLSISPHAYNMGAY